MPVAPRDPALALLADLLPPRGAPPLLCETLREMGIDVDGERAAVVYLRYRPGKNCDIAWRFRHPSGWPGLVSARVFRSDRGERIARRPAFQALAARAQEWLGIATEPYRYLEDRRTLVQLFPLDFRLPGLIDATSPAWASAVLPGLLERGGADACRVAVRPKVYRAWRRCVLEYEREGERPQRYFAKLYRDDCGAMMPRLETIGRQLTGGPWQVVTPAAYLAEQRMLVIPAIEAGVTCTSLIKAGARDLAAKQQAASVAERAAEGLERLQRVEVDGLPTVTARDIVAELRRKSARIELVEPELAQAIAGRLQALETACAALSPEALVPAHGAFRHSQLLLRGEGLVVLDLDTLCRSGANADAGSFLACLDRLAVRRHPYEPVVRECQDAFARAWRRAPAAHEGWLAWHRAAGLVKQAVRTYTSLPARWPQTTAALLRLAGETGPC